MKNSMKKSMKKLNFRIPVNYFNVVSKFQYQEEPKIEFVNFYHPLYKNGQPPKSKCLDNIPKITIHTALKNS